MLNPISVFLVTIGFIYAYHLNPWDSVAGNIYPFKLAGHNVAIYSQEVPSAYGLTYEAIMLGLWDGIVAMSEWNRYESSVVEIFNHDRMIGKIYIIPLSDALDTSHNATTTTLGDVAGKTELPEPLTDASTMISSNADDNDSNDADSGRYTNPLRPDVSIPYEFSGPRIYSKDIFTAIIEGLIIVAHDGANKPFSYLTGVSASGHCALHLKQTGRAGTGLYATTLLELLTEMLVTLRRFQAVEFALEQGKAPDWKRFIEGYFMWLGRPTGSPGENVTTA
ncbi:MAG: hypothetical protein Q9201_005902 [Fulgogasparrea decipioides]